MEILAAYCGLSSFFFFAFFQFQVDAKTGINFQSYSRTNYWLSGAGRNEFGLGYLQGTDIAHYTASKWDGFGLTGKMRILMNLKISTISLLLYNTDGNYNLYYLVSIF